MLVGEGGCRGDDWDSDNWPKPIKGDKTADECGSECYKNAKCTGFHLTKASKKKSAEKRSCSLYGHEDYVAVKGLGGECYQITRGE